MTKEEEDIKNDVLECLYKLYELFARFAAGESLHTKNIKEAKQYRDELRTIINKCNKADFIIRK